MVNIIPSRRKSAIRSKTKRLKKPTLAKTLSRKQFNKRLLRATSVHSVGKGKRTRTSRLLRKMWKLWSIPIVLIAVGVYWLRTPFFKKFEPVSYTVSLPDKFDGPLSVNDRLEKTEKLHENIVVAPESFAVHNGEIYTGLLDGRIVRVTADAVTDITRTGKECAGMHEEHICGRPAGMRFSKNGTLYVIDVYHGLFTVDPESGGKINLLPSSLVVEGEPLTFLNSLALDEKARVIYITQSTTRWSVSMMMLSVIEHDSTGRLLKFDLKTKKVTVLLKGLGFANGIEVTKDGSALLVAESNRHKIIKYHLTGPQKGKHEDLPLVLPGEPDNISRSKRGNFWIGIASARTMESPSIYDRLSEKPMIRKLIINLFKLAALPYTTIMKLMPHKWVQEIAFQIETGRFFVLLAKSHGIIVEIDENGKILQSLHSPSGHIAHISEVLELDNYLYLGSWQNPYLGRLKIKQ